MELILAFIITILATVLGTIWAISYIDERKKRKHQKGSYLGIPVDLAEAEEYLSWLKDLCELRDPHAKIQCLYEKQIGHYLRVSIDEQGTYSIYPLFGINGDVTQTNFEKVQAFNQRYQQEINHSKSIVVYNGKLSAKHQQALRAQRVILYHFMEYRNLINFLPYIESQALRLAKDVEYDSRLFIPQRLDYEYNAPSDKNNALKSLGDWLQESQKGILLILGDFGTGKTFLLRELAQQLNRAYQDNHNLPAPLFIEMRELEKASSLNELMAQHLAKYEVDFKAKAFERMLADGNVVLLFDGFDELELRIGYDRVTEHLQTLSSALTGACAHVIVSARSQHFKSQQQIRSALQDHVLSQQQHQIAYLSGFNEPQIRQYLTKRFQDEGKAQEHVALLRRVKDLLGLSENPRMLSFILQIQPETLQAVADKDGHISAAKLYHTLIEQWLSLEQDKVSPPGGRATLEKQHRWQAVEQLALVLWQKTEAAVSWQELGTEIQTHLKPLLDISSPSNVLMEVGCRSLLSRDNDDHFRFIHQSVLEWLVAKQAASQLHHADPSLETLFNRHKLSSLMADFFLDLAGHDEALAWAQAQIQKSEQQQGLLKDNAHVLLKRLNKNVTGANYSGEDLRGKDFSYQDLNNADFSDANLEKANFTGAQCRYASFKGANCAGVRFDEADLRECDFKGADCHHGSFLGTLIQDLEWDEQTRWDYARLLGKSLPLPMEPEMERLPTGVRIGLEDLCGQSLPNLGYVRSVAFRDEFILGSGSDNAVMLWDSYWGQAIFDLNSTVAHIAYSPSGSHLAGGSYDNTVKLWDTDSGKQRLDLRGHTDYVRSVAYSPSGSELASGSSDKTVKLWDTDSGKQRLDLRGHERRVLSVAYSPSGSELASGSDDKTVKLWDTDSGKQRLDLRGHTGWVRSVAYSPSGSELASGSSDNTVKLWDTETGKQRFDLRGHTDYVRSVAYSPSGSELASGSSDKTVKLWNTDSGKQRLDLRGHTDWVRSVAYSPSGSELASGSDDKTVKLWDTDSGKQRLDLRGHEGTVWSVAYSPSGSELASGSDDKTVKLWDTDSGKQRLDLRGHEYAVNSVAYSPSGSELASGSDDKTVKLWDTETGRQRLDLHGHEGRVWSVTYSPSGSRLASGSDDKTVKLWDTKTGACLQTLSGHNGAVLSVSFKDENHLISSGVDNTMRLWRISDGLCLAVWVLAPEGWALYLAQGLPRYKYGGNVRNYFWHRAGLCRYDIGDLDKLIPNLRMDEDEPLPFWDTPERD